MTIIIRRAEPEDYAAVAAILSGPSAVRGTLQVPFPSLDRWRKNMAEPPDGMIMLVAVADGEVVAHLGLEQNPNRPRRKHTASFGMAVRDDWQGKGVGTALMRAVLDLADNWLNLERLELEVYTDNEPAVRLYQKFGFEIEGTARRFGFRDGKYVDAYHMSRLRPAAAPPDSTG
jgi:putative acetyltransferase